MIPKTWPQKTQKATKRKNQLIDCFSYLFSWLFVFFVAIWLSSIALLREKQAERITKNSARNKIADSQLRIGNS
jgi:hypothetical protein